MTWAGIVACQMGAAFAVRANHASLRQVGFFSNPYLLRGIAFALTFAVADHLRTADSVDFPHDRASPPALYRRVLACFPVIIWGSDELWRWRARRQHPGPVRHPEPAPAGAS